MVSFWQAQVGGSLRKPSQLPCRLTNGSSYLSWDGKLRLFQTTWKLPLLLTPMGTLLGLGHKGLWKKWDWNSFEGLIDDVRIFEQALSAAQRQEV